MNKTAKILLTAVLITAVAAVIFDRVELSRYEAKFKELEKQRIIFSNKLATAKIVYENLNHVRDLVFKNMDFPGPGDTASNETVFFDFLTSCINDLKLELISVKPLRPVTTQNITTYGYNIEIKGDFFKFGELCAKFENSRRIIAIENFDVDLNSTDNPGDVFSGHKGINVRMRVNTFRVRKT